MMGFTFDCTNSSSQDLFPFSVTLFASVIFYFLSFFFFPYCYSAVLDYSAELGMLQRNISKNNVTYLTF
jgi:hypothetical protein